MELALRRTRRQISGGGGRGIDFSGDAKERKKKRLDLDVKKILSNLLCHVLQ